MTNQNILSEDRLWTKRELARYTGYSENYIQKLLQIHPERLPPRAPNIQKARWNPEIVKRFFNTPFPSKDLLPKTSKGRPRNTVII